MASAAILSQPEATQVKRCLSDRMEISREAERRWKDQEAADEALARQMQMNERRRSDVQPIVDSSAKVGEEARRRRDRLPSAPKYEAVYICPTSAAL